MHMELRLLDAYTSWNLTHAYELGVDAKKATIYSTLSASSSKAFLLA